jgi:hypothetical protein
MSTWRGRNKTIVKEEACPFGELWSICSVHPNSLAIWQFGPSEQTRVVCFIKIELPVLDIGLIPCVPDNVIHPGREKL